MEADFDAPEAVVMPSDKSVPDDGSDAIEKWLAENIGSDNDRVAPPPGSKGPMTLDIYTL